MDNECRNYSDLAKTISFQNFYKTLRAKTIVKTELTVDWIFSLFGYLPNSEFLQTLVQLSPSGHVVVDHKYQTSQPGVRRSSTSRSRNDCVHVRRTLCQREKDVKPMIHIKIFLLFLAHVSSTMGVDWYPCKQCGIIVADCGDTAVCDGCEEYLCWKCYPQLERGKQTVCGYCWNDEPTIAD